MRNMWKEFSSECRNEKWSYWDCKGPRGGFCDRSNDKKGNFGLRKNKERRKIMSDSDLLKPPRVLPLTVGACVPLAPSKEAHEHR